MLESDNIFDEVHMICFDEEEKLFMIYDKESGKIYDVRNESHLQKLEEDSLRVT